MLNLDEKQIDLYENWFSYSEEELKELINHPEKSDNKIFKYYQKFNSILISKLKHLIEKHILEDKLASDNTEKELYNEVTRHLHKFQSLTREMFFFSNEFSLRVNRLIDLGKTRDHMPLFIYGGALSGKTLTLVNFAQEAFKNIQSKTCLTIIKFGDLTTKCSSFEDLFYSLCQQLCVLNHLNPQVRLKNKDMNELVECFFKMCKDFSEKNQQNNLLILIDGLKDLIIDRSLLKKTNASNNQITWLFKEKLPARVHMIVTVKRLSAKNRLNTSSNSVYSNNSLTSVDDNKASLFGNCFSENMLDSMNLFELPLGVNCLKNELNEFVKIELAKKNKYLTQSQIGLVIHNAMHCSSHLNLGKKDTPESNQFFLYVNLIFNELTEKYCSLFDNCVLDKDSLPPDCDTIVKAKLREYFYLLVVIVGAFVFRDRVDMGFCKIKFLSKTKYLI